jgi:ribosomal protein RSM22 (predicted rRNA methylase)
MQLPASLRLRIEQVLEGFSASELAQAAQMLSQRYRADIRDGRAHVDAPLAASAYLAVRLPATFAAVRASLQAVAVARPDFAPQTLLDLGAGPGTALWAAADCWRGIADALLVEASAAMRDCGARLGSPESIARTAWDSSDLVAQFPSVGPRDLVTVSYVLGELAPEARESVIARAWALTADILMLVEPGTPAGWERILAARDRLIALDAHILAPCPHAAACPLVSPDWCHFARRLPRSRLHRLAKDADAPFEDEKFIYLAVSRRPGRVAGARVISRPRTASGQVRVKLCTMRGTSTERLFTRRERETFRTARRLDWGDLVDLDGGANPHA